MKRSIILLFWLCVSSLCLAVGKGGYATAACLTDMDTVAERAQVVDSVRAEIQMCYCINESLNGIMHSLADKEQEEGHGHCSYSLIFLKRGGSIYEEGEKPYLIVLLDGDNEIINHQKGTNTYYYDYYGKDTDLTGCVIYNNVYFYVLNTAPEDISLDEIIRPVEHSSMTVRLRTWNLPPGVIQFHECWSRVYLYEDGQFVPWLSRPQ